VVASAAVLASFGASATTYEYTAKVVSGTGVPKVTVTTWACASWWGGTPCGQVSGYTDAAAGAGVVCSWSAVATPPATLHSGTTYRCTYNGGPSASFPVVMTAANTAECPAGTSEGAGGLCYSSQCPTATPPWEQDPDNPAQCRRATCPSPQVSNGASCSCQSGKIGQIGNLGLWSEYTGVKQVTSSDPSLAMPSTFCVVEDANTEGCTVNTDTASFNGTRWQYTGSSFTGATCTGGSNGGAESGLGAVDGTDVGECGQGKVKGTVNGATVCLKAGVTETKAQPVVKVETTVNPDGTSTVTTTTTTDTTKCVDGVCTVSTSSTVTKQTKDTNGNVTGTTTTTGTETGKAPTGSGKGKGTGGEGTASSFGGACPTFKCDGDAVVCAIALEQHKRNCEQFGEYGGAYSKADAVKAFDEVRSFDSKSLTTSGGTFGDQISATAFLGSTACVPDQTVTLGNGESFIIPWSSVCTAMQAAGLAFLAVCGVIAFRIVARGTEG